jgi:acyl-coenzyme A synthetase/AMP-(fatty) acid ligase
MWANARHCVDRFQLSQDERVAIPVPLSHMYGFAAALLPAVLAKSAVDIQADSNIIRYLQHEAEFEPTTVYLTPSFCYALVRLQQAKRRYRLTVSAGDKTPPDIFRRYEDAHGCLVSLYGSTELGAVAGGSPDDPFHLRADSTGRPMPGVLVTHAVQPLENDAATSELCFDHPAGGEGYADERGEVIRTDARFVAGRLMSRDVGGLGADGYLRVAGRSDHLVKRDGRLVALGDIEVALLKNHIVEAAVVLSDGVTPRGAQLTAVCVARNHDGDERSLRDATRQHLPAYAVPDRVILIDDIPRLESGKADRAALARYVADANKAAL